MFEWDVAKNQANLAKHGVSFEQAKQIFDHPRLSWVDTRKDYGEVREISIGLLEGQATLVVVHTKRGHRTRIISARPASQQERKRYAETIRSAPEYL